MEKAKEKILKILKKETKLKEINLEVPPNPEMGDYAFPCFQLSKKFKKNHPLRSLSILAIWFN